MPHPKPNPRLMLMPLLMPGTLTTAILTDTMGMVDTMDTVDGGSAMLKPMPNPKLMPRPIPPSFTPMLTVTPLSILMDTLTDTPALTTLMLITMLPLLL